MVTQPIRYFTLHHVYFQGPPGATDRDPQEHVRLPLASLHLHAHLQGGCPLALHTDVSGITIAASRGRHLEGVDRAYRVVA